MSLLSRDDYINSSKKNNVVSPRRASHGGITTSKKVKLPTKYKTRKHKCAHCPSNDAKQYAISEKETRWLCEKCVMRHNASNSKEKPHFLQASKLSRN